VPFAGIKLIDLGLVTGPPDLRSRRADCNHRPAVISFALLSVLTGIIYPAPRDGYRTIAFPHQARGSLIVRNGKPVGSQLIGQSFSDPKYSGAARPHLAAAVQRRRFGRIELGSAQSGAHRCGQDANSGAAGRRSGNKAPVPVDLVTASGSGLDPHISVAAAQYQMARVAHARSLDVRAVQALVAAHMEGRLWGVSVSRASTCSRLNLALDDHVLAVEEPPRRDG